jgi:predicted HTH transcriptional regulator
MGKVNPYRTELHSIKERYIDVNTNAEVIEHWETEQLQIFNRQVKNSYEGLIRALKPYSLVKTSKRKQINKIEKIIRKGENNKTEFKSSLRWDSFQRKTSVELEKTVMKSIAAFLNTSGGKLLIGINDVGESIGIENDFDTFKRKNRDGFEQHLMTLLDNYLGSDKSIYISPEFLRYNGNMISIITIKKSPYPVYTSFDSTNEFYIRAGNTARKLDGNQLQDYIKSHFK